MEGGTGIRSWGAETWVFPSAGLARLAHHRQSRPQWAKTPDRVCVCPSMVQSKEPTLLFRVLRAHGATKALLHLLLYPPYNIQFLG